MCGIFGVVSNGIRNHAEFYEFLCNLFIRSEQRGRDASGFAAIADGKFIADKRAVSATKFSKLSKVWRTLMHANQLSLIGHTRAATNGTPSNNMNNHPFHGPRFSMAHNGGIGYFRQIARENKFKLDTDCDSEIILHFLEQQEQIQKGIVECLAQCDPVGTMAVCTLDRASGGIHLFRTGWSPCSLFKFERWNALVFASTPRIVAMAAAQALGSMGNVYQSAEYVFDNDRDGNIPEYSHVEITAGRQVSVKNLNKEITELTKNSKRGRVIHHYRRGNRRANLDFAVFNGGTSKYESTSKDSKESLENTQMMDECPECKSPVSLETIGSNHQYCSSCGSVFDENSTGSSQKNKASASDLAVLYGILPPDAAALDPSEITSYLSGVRDPGETDDERFNITSYSLNEYLRFYGKEQRDKLIEWDEPSKKKLLEMGDGEYLAYFIFVENLIEELVGSAWSDV